VTEVVGTLCIVGREKYGALCMVERQIFSALRPNTPWEITDNDPKVEWYPIECIEHIYISETFSSMR
jgi:hypothetical protein